MEMIIQIWGGLALLVIFLKPTVDARLVKTGATWPLETWHLAVRILWGGVVWAMATVFTSAALHTVFPKEPVYLLSGSWITVGPALFWGGLIVWIVSGKREAGEGQPKTASVDGRIDTVFDVTASIVARGTKIILWIVGALIAMGLIYLFSSWVNKEVAEMAPSTAIVVGAVIIAWAIYATRR